MSVRIANLAEIKERFIVVAPNSDLITYLESLCQRSEELLFDNNCVCYCSIGQKATMRRLQDEVKLQKNLD